MDVITIGIAFGVGVLLTITINCCLLGIFKKFSFCC